MVLLDFDIVQLFHLIHVVIISTINKTWLSDCLNWLIGVDLLILVLLDYLRELLKPTYDIFHKLFPIYFHKFFKIAYENNF